LHFDVEMLKLLKAHGVSLKSRDRIGETLLTFPAGGGHLECVKWLLRQGLSLTDMDDRGRTALQMATENGWHEVVEFLRSLMYSCVD
jgi:ankyrin repeat protein